MVICGSERVKGIIFTISVNFQTKREQEEQLQLEDIILLNTNLYFS